jgi:hypothetical protein
MYPLQSLCTPGQSRCTHVSLYGTPGGLYAPLGSLNALISVSASLSAPLTFSTHTVDSIYAPLTVSTSLTVSKRPCQSFSTVSKRPCQSFSTVSKRPCQSFSTVSKRPCQSFSRRPDSLKAALPVSARPDSLYDTP